MKLFVSLLLFVTPVVARADTKLEKGAAWDCKKDPTVSIPNGGGQNQSARARPPKMVELSRHGNRMSSHSTAHSAVLAERGCSATT